jgi:hypothetical protein
MQKFLYAPPRAANKKKYEPALFQLSRLDSAPALGTLSSEKWARCAQDAYAEDPTSTTEPG